MSSRRAAAIGALLFGFGGLALATVEAVQEFPRGLIALALLFVGACVGWYGLLRTGPLRVPRLCCSAHSDSAARLP